MNFNSPRDIISIINKLSQPIKNLFLIYLVGIVFLYFQCFVGITLSTLKGSNRFNYSFDFGSFGVLYSIKHKKEPHKVAFVIILLFLGS